VFPQDVATPIALSKVPTSQKELSQGGAEERATTGLPQGWATFALTNVYTAAFTDHTAASTTTEMATLNATRTNTKKSTAAATAKQRRSWLQSPPLEHAYDVEHCLHNSLSRDSFEKTTAVDREHGNDDDGIAAATDRLRTGLGPQTWSCRRKLG
jgi:hypothetical protein